MLILRWPQWLHRRVELVTFEDSDVIRRSSSLDFTFPRWALNVLKIDGTDAMNIAVPVALFRKGELVHFSLSSEGSNSIPLLSTPQIWILGEAALLATAEIALGNQPVPREIVCDIRRLVQDDVWPEPGTSKRVGPAIESLERLFSIHEPEPEARTILQSHPYFSALADALSTQLIGAVLLPIEPSERRVIHFAYDEKFLDIRYRQPRGLWTRLERLYGKRARRVYIFAASPSDSASYHFEAEASEGLQISSAKASFMGINRVPERKQGSYQRIHFHFPRLPRGCQLIIELRLRPRSSTIVRGSALTATLTLAGVLYVFFRVGEIPNQGMVTALLVVPSLLSLYLVRSNEHPMTTHLLWPLRIVATAPGVLSLLTAGVLVSNLPHYWSKLALWWIVGLLALSAGTLFQIWWQASRRERRRSFRSP